jgi:hypothetical protein
MDNVAGYSQPMFYPEFCVQCQKPIEVISPKWYHLDWDYVNSRLRWHYRPDETALCVTCCLARTKDAERPVWESHLSGLMARKADTGLRDDITMFHHRTHNEHIYSRVRGVFQYDQYFAHYRGPLPDDCTLPRATIAQDGSIPLTLLHVGWDFVLEGVPAVARFSWTIDDVRREGELRIDGWSRATHPQLMRLMEGARALMQAPAVGRPRGTTDYSYEDYAQSFSDVTRSLGRPPKSLDEFVENSNLSRDTIKRDMKRWGITWRKFRDNQSAA